jgi:hypothetical protein
MEIIHKILKLLISVSKLDLLKKIGILTVYHSDAVSFPF